MEKNAGDFQAGIGAEEQTGSGSMEEAMKRGIADSESGNREGAYVIFRQVTEQHPTVADPWVWLGWSSPSIDEAEAAFRRALEIKPDSEEANMGMQWVANERGQGEQSPSEAGSSSSAPDPATEADSGSHSLADLMQMGIAAAQAGDKATAFVTFQSVVDRYPDVPEAWVWLAGSTTNLDDAERAFQMAANLEPANEEARLGLRWVALRRQVTGAPVASMSSGVLASDSANGGIKPYDTGVLSSRNLSGADAEEPMSPVMKFFRQPGMLLAVVILISIIVIAWMIIRGGR